MFISTRFGENPRTARQRRAMTNMLPVATGKVSHPITVFVLVKSDNGLLHEHL
jgi:hypothetical protein